MTIDFNSMSDLASNEDPFATVMGENQSQEETTQADEQEQASTEETPQEITEETNNSLFDSEETTEETPSESDADSWTISTKVNGKEETIDLKDPEVQEKISKIWSLEKAARQAISEKGRLSKEMKELKKQLENGNLNDETREIVEHLKSQKGDINGLFKTLTGSSFEDYVEEAIKKKQAYEGLSESERAVFDMKDKLTQQDYKLSKFQKEIEEKNKAITEREAEIQQKELYSRLEPAFEKQAEIFDGLPDATENAFRKALWRDTLDLLSKAESKGYEINQALIKKAFATKAKAFKHAIENKAQSKTEEIINNKKETAKKNMQAAAKQGTSSMDIDKLKKMSPMELFNNMFGK